MPGKILLIDDDKLMRRSLAFNLEQAGFSTFTAQDAETGINLVEQHQPDLIILDIGLPGMDGLDALKIFRDQMGLPVILLTARRRGMDEILGLELGADDYITKPFEFDILLAHVKAVLRRTIGSRSAPPGSGSITCGDLTIDPAAHQALLQEQPLNLSPKEFDLLYLLATNAGKVLSADDILARVWGAEFEGQPQVVYVHIRWLREKLGESPQGIPRIQTIRGVGYKYNPQEI
ncbi:MAG: response regulator transcription factor [Leptolinea sp.]|jgi:DNA-binding response OmpR family regulator|nr:response regulator transcription factor [Leptolinea sp.]